MRQKLSVLVVCLIFVYGTIEGQTRAQTISRSAIIGSGAGNVAQVIEMLRPGWWRSIRAAKTSNLRLTRRASGVDRQAGPQQDWRCLTVFFVGEDAFGEIPEDLALEDVASIRYFPAASNDRPDGGRQCDGPAVQVVLVPGIYLPGVVLSEEYVVAAEGSRPEKLSCPELEYPPALRQSRIQGSVVVQVVVDTAGKTERGSVKIVSATHDGFRQPVIKLMNACRWTPGTVSGRPVRVLMQIPIQFALTGG